LFSPHEKEIDDNLVSVVGTEMDIRIRQNMFLIMDKIINKAHRKLLTQLSSGSLVEGLDLPGSDMDIMFLLNNVQVIQNVQLMNRSARCTTLLVEDEMEFPGFSRLNKLVESYHEYKFPSSECFVQTRNGIFLSNISFIRNLIERSNYYKQSAHAPCLSDKDESLDLAFCFHLQNNGYIAIDVVSGHPI